MTRRSLTAVLGSLLVGLLLVINVPVVRAEGGCDPADAGTVDQCVALAAQAHAAIASTSSRLLCTHPLVGIPTCYAEQADGTWARVEMTHDESLARAYGDDAGAVWFVVGTVTFDEVVAAVGGVNAIAP